MVLAQLAIEAGNDSIAAAGEAEYQVALDSPDQDLIAAGNEPALAGAERLGRVQADDVRGIARPHGIEAGGGIDHDRQSRAAPKLVPSLHIDRRAEGGNWHDGPNFTLHPIGN